ncbi:MAG: hypothetical protein GF317_20680 [Candidatus Lokiarchaeota archaeon]|nr:hypothetical protein [Candidatus Lokiarchaeota archaeon]MBD3201881.1 hypothetical protein [Candidatus Lokiarchaeota archaeon]
MSTKGRKTIEGRIVEVRDGSRKINRTYTYGYRSLRVFSDNEYYSVLINTNKFNKYGFIPKVGQCIRVTGRISQNENEFYEPSISWVTELEHIECPKKRNQ